MTQNEQITRDLLKGKVITPLAALDKYGCFRLASRISELRERGLDIAVKQVKTATGKRVAGYYLRDTKAARIVAKHQGKVRA